MSKYLFRTPEGLEDLIIVPFKVNNTDEDVWQVVEALDENGNSVEKYHKSKDGAVYGIVGDLIRIHDVKLEKL